MKSLRISACYIVKNEADVLAKSLESIREQVDTIVVVDTGSSDKTIEIARNYGAQVVSYTWQEHFAAARNFALDQLQADWVVFLDADEYFTSETKANVRQEIESADREGKNLLLIQWKNYDADTGRHLVDVYTPRIFRLSPALRYEGRIHEQLRQNGGDVKGVKLVPEHRLTLIHTGYSSHLSREKAARNLKLLLMDLAESRHPEALYMALAEAYDGVGDEENAIRYAKMDIDRGRQPATYASRSYRLLLKLLAERPKAFAERMEIAARAVNDFPELPEFHAEYAECLAQARQFEAAVGEALKAERAFMTYRSIEPLQFGQDGLRILSQRRAVWEKRTKQENGGEGTCQGEVFLGIGKREGTGQMTLGEAKKAIEDGVCDEAVLNRYCVLRGEIDTGILATELESLYGNRERELDFLLRWAERNGWISLYLQFADQMERRFSRKIPRAELYRLALQGDWRKVQEKTVAGLAASFSRLVISLLLLENEGTPKAKTMSQECLALLPPSAAAVWTAYERAETIYNEDAFNAMFPVVLCHGKEEQIARMAVLSGGLSTAKLYEVGKQVMAEDYWAAAFAAFSQIPAEAPEVTAEFWENVGICLYHLQEWETAAECFDRSVAMDKETPKIASYRHWMKDSAIADDA